MMYIKYFIYFLIFYFNCLNANTENHSQGQKSIAREKLLKVFTGEWVARCLYVAAKFNIADHLESGPKSIQELAEKTETNPDSLQRTLRLLVSAGVFKENEQGVFSNNNASELLCRNSQSVLHSLSLFYGPDINEKWDHLLPKRKLAQN